MTECCLFVPCRPRTYTRLVQDLYPKSSSGFDINIGPPNKLGRLCSYAAAYPQKIPDLCGALLKNAEKTGVQHKFMYALEAPMHRLLLMCFADRDSTVLALGASVFFVYTQLHDRCDVGPYMRPILGLCLRSMLGSKNAFDASTFSSSKTLVADEKINNPIVSGPFGVWSLLAGIGSAEGVSSSSSFAAAEGADASKSSLVSSGSTLLPSIGLELLLRTIEILLSHPGDLEKYCADILPIVYYFYSSQKVFFVDAIPGFGAPPSGAGSNPPGSGGGSFWAPRSPVVISTLCLVALGSTSSPATASHVVACLMAWLDENRWEPLLPAVKAFRLIGSCSSSVNNYVLPLGSMLLSHARSIVNNPMDWNKAADAMGHSAVLYERKSLTPLGSEVALRSTELRSRVIINVLLCIDELFKCEYSSSSRGSAPRTQDRSGEGPADTCTGFNRMLRGHDVENIAEILIFASLNYGGATLSWQSLVDTVAPELFSGERSESVLSRDFSNGFGAELVEPSGSESVQSSCALEMQALCMKCIVHIARNSLVLLNDFASFSVTSVLVRNVISLRTRFSYLVEGSVLERGLRLSLLQASYVSVAAADAAYLRLKPARPTAMTADGKHAAYLFANMKHHSPSVIVDCLLREKDLLAYLILCCMHSDWGTHLTALRTVHSLFVGADSFDDVERPSIDSYYIVRNRHHFFNWTKKLETPRAFLSSIYKIIYRCLTVYNGPSHSETVAHLWQINMMIVKCYGAQELYFGLPLIAALHGVFTSAQIPDLGPIPLQENRLAFETLELHSGQILYFFAYLRYIATILSASDLNIILLKLYNECCKLFPWFPDVPSRAAASHRRGAQGPLRVSSSGRRLVLDGGDIRLATSVAPIKSDCFSAAVAADMEVYDFSESRDGMSLQILAAAFKFLNHGIDFESIKDTLSLSLEVAFTNSFSNIKPIQGPTIHMSKFKLIMSKFRSEIMSRFDAQTDLSHHFLRIASEGDAECTRDLVELDERRAQSQDLRVAFEDSENLSKFKHLLNDYAADDIIATESLFRPVSLLPSRPVLEDLRTSLSCLVDVGTGLVDPGFSFGLVDESRHGKPGTFLKKAGSPAQTPMRAGSFDAAAGNDDDTDGYLSVASSDAPSSLGTSRPADRHPGTPSMRGTPSAK